MTVSDEILKRVADSYRRIRNTSRFLLSNINGFNPETDMLDEKSMLALDRWAVAKTLDLQNQIIDAYKSYNFHLIYQKLHNFCAVELGGFYLDVIKDRQYTTQENSIARRSAQTAMYHIIEAMTRWLAPILSFTAEEIWQVIPGAHDESVLLETWYENLFDLDKSEMMNFDFWSNIQETRTYVSKQLEKLRVAGDIGSSLDAEVTLYCDETLLKQLSALENELRFALITSEASVDTVANKSDAAVEVTMESGQTLYIDTQVTRHNKCVRCWHHREDVGSHAEHPELCSRCIDNVTGSGEQRHHA